MPWFADCETICRPDVLLAEHTWYQLGGPARWLVTPRTESELAEVVAACGAEGVPWRVLGRGANVLVRDEGFEGAVILLKGIGWETGQFDDDGITAGGGADFVQFVKRAVGRGLAGLERLAGIPGTLGGVVRMNAGGKHGSIGDLIEWVRVLRPDGQIVKLSADAVGFSYRRTNLAQHIVLAARCKLEPSSPEMLHRRYSEIWNEKYRTQPPLSQRSSGCVFKNPGPAPAGKLVDEAGLKGRRIGGAEISGTHANFIVAANGATAQDVLDLIQLAQDCVRARSGVELELEVEVW